MVYELSKYSLTIYGILLVVISEFIDTYRRVKCPALALDAFIA